MAQRIVNGVRLGTARDAAAECTTGRSPNGVTVQTYRYYETSRGAPRPYTDPATGFRSRSPETGEQEYDLDAVARWNREGRPRPGAYLRDVAHRTQIRHQVLAAIGAGELRARITGDLKVELTRVRAVSVGDDEPFVGRVNRRAFSDFQRAKLVAVPAEGGTVTLTDAGRQLLDQWNAETAGAGAG